MSEIKDILLNLGYQVTDDKDGYRMRPLYRASSNITSLKVFNNGSFIDFSAGIRGNISELVKLTLNLKDIKDAKEWLKTKDYQPPEISKEEPKIKFPKYFDLSILENFKPDHTYWLKRGISKEIIEQFGGGVCNEWKLKNRYVFPIFKDNKKNKVIGFAGRSLYPESKMKWKLLGAKKEFKFPIIDSKNLNSIILCESVGDSLSLIESKIDNVMTLFGIELFNEHITYLIRLNPQKIIISLNDDINKTKAGNNAAEKIKTRLIRYFDSNKIFITTPNYAETKCKDWNEVLIKYGPDKIRKILD